jgi:amino acid adenylation domain-containing protein
VALRIPDEVLRRLRAFAAEESTTLFTVLLAAYKTLLFRLTRQTDLIVGTPLAGREHPVTQQLVGCFVKTVALRTDLGGTGSFRDVTRRVHATTVEAHDHQAVPFEHVVAELRTPREPNYSPVFQTLFGLQSSDVLGIDGVRIGHTMLECDSAKWDLAVSLTETSEGLGGFVEYSCDLFDEATAARYADMLTRLVAILSEQPDRAIGEHPLVTDDERQRILRGLNAYARPSHPYRTMAEPFEEQAKRTPDAIALVADDATMTYAELNERANRLACFLRAAGARRGTRVALSAQRSVATVVALYAISKSGAAYVPLDPDLPDARLQFMLDDTSPLIVLADRESRPRMTPGPWQVVSLDDDTGCWSSLPAGNVPCDGPPHHPVHLLYTSGSTGRPKAVTYPVDGAIANIFALQESYPFHPGDATVFKTSYGFDVSIWEIFWPLYFGARLIVGEPGAHRDPRRLVELIERHDVSAIFLIPTFMQVFLDALPAGSCRSLRWAFCGGEPVTPRIRDAFHARLGATLVNCYGPTEAGCVTDMALCPDPGSPTVPLGRPAANFRMYVLDEELEVLPIGVPGDAYIGGETGVGQGYFNRPELTAERFVPDPFGVAGARMYRTGDICRYRDDGVLEHLGRRGRQLKLRGMRVEPAEIEAVLCEHPAVEECVVMTAPDDRQSLVAFAVPRRDTTLSESALRDHARRLLPRSMVPVSITAVDHIPVNVNGKTDRDALLGRRRSSGSPSSGVVRPSGEREVRLARIFARILGVAEVSVTESFFELGGHSLLIFKLIADCSQELHVSPSVADVFAASSVRELATRLGSSAGDPDASLVPLMPTAGRPIIVFVHAASGSAVPFFDVARHLGSAYSTYALQSAPAASPGGRQTIAGLAARYVQAVDPVRGLSPLVLAGWSMGGCVALEMARQWQEEGVAVDATLMLDTWLPPPALAHGEAQAQARIAIRGLDVLDMEGIASTHWAHTDAFAQLSDTLDRNRDAFLEYDPARFEGHVHLLRAAEPLLDASPALPDEYARAACGWDTRIADLTVQEVPGNHFTLLGEDNAARLADTIRAIVDLRLSFVEV